MKWTFVGYQVQNQVHRSGFGCGENFAIKFTRKLHLIYVHLSIILSVRATIASTAVIIQVNKFSTKANGIYSSFSRNPT